MAGFLWAASAAAIIFSCSAVVDMVLTFFTALSFACFWRAFMHTSRSIPAAIGFYVAFALSMMAKAPLPGITVGIALALFWLVALPLVAAAEEPQAGDRRFLVRARSHAWMQFKRILSLGVLWGFPLWLVIVAAWPLDVHRHYGNAWLLWKMEYYDMATGGGMDRRPQPFWYYLPLIFALTGAFLLSLPEAVAAPFIRRYRRQRVGLAMAFTWGMWGLLALSLITTKRWYYPLSIMPAFCLLLAPVVDRLFFGPPSVDPDSQARVRWACRALPVVIAAALVGIGIALRRQFADMMPAYSAIAAVLFVALTAACITFLRGRRTFAFAWVNLGASSWRARPGRWPVGTSMSTSRPGRWSPS